MTAADTSAALPDKRLTKVEYIQGSKPQEQQNNECQQRQYTSIIRNRSIAAEAYRLFYKGKNIMHIAIELNLKQAGVAQYQREYYLKTKYRLQRSWKS
jgi:hypothetical protein